MEKLLEDIECFLLDMDGTLYLGGKAIDGAPEAVKRMQKNARVLYLTNNTSRARADYVKKLGGMGFDATADDVYTAGNATIDYLKEKGVKRVFLLGTPALKEEFENAGIACTEDMPELAVVGFDVFLTYENLAKLCSLIRGGLPYIATHPDFNCPVDGGFIPDVGSFLALIMASTGRVPQEICGKPYGAIARGVAKRAGTTGKRIAMVGDRLMTDMRFAVEQGFTSVLVLSGEATKEELAASGLSVDYVLGSVAEIL